MTEDARRDRVFLNNERGSRRFAFDASVAAAFEDMAQRSIPGYEESIRTVCWLAARELTSGVVYDLGASTGTLELALAPWLLQTNARVIAVDLSEEMVARGQGRTHAAGLSERVEWRCEDVAQTEVQDASLVVANYVFQFMDPALRSAAYQRVFDGMRPGAWFVLSEKTVESSGDVEGFFRARYEDFKRTQGYTEEEIENKRVALEGVLRPWTVQQTEAALSQIGFHAPVMLIRWWNFVTWVAQKPQD